MANDLSVLIPTVLAEGLEVLRETCAAMNAVNIGYTEEARDPRGGSAITIPIPVAQAVVDVTPSNTPPSNTDNTPTSTTLNLNKWKKTDFQMTDKSKSEIESGNFKRSQAAESVRALANQIDSDLLATATADGGVYNHVVTAGTTPFATEALFQTAWQKGARKLLNDGLAPQSDRHVIMDSDADGNLGSLVQFTDADRSGSSMGMVEGAIGRKMGADWALDNNVQTFTGGTLTNGSGKLALVNGAVSAAAVTMAIDETSLSGTLVDGDVFTVANVSGYFQVTNGTLTAAANAIAVVNFTPAAPTGGFADNAVITFAADHVVNLAFHRNAFALAFSNILDTDEGIGGNIIESIQDPVTGVVLRLEISREYKQTTWRFDTLYGVKCVRPELACRILG